MVTVNWLTFFISILQKLKTGLSQVKSKLFFKKMRLLWKESRKQKVLDFKVVKLENKFLKKNQQIKTILLIV
jgi:hypothetical protein